MIKTIRMNKGVSPTRKFINQRACKETKATNSKHCHHSATPALGLLTWVSITSSVRARGFHEGRFAGKPPDRPDSSCGRVGKTGALEVSWRSASPRVRSKSSEANRERRRLSSPRAPRDSPRSPPSLNLLRVPFSLFIFGRSLFSLATMTQSHLPASFGRKAVLFSFSSQRGLARSWD